MATTGKIGVFDSGYGGLTVLRSIVDRLPEYDYLYLGDNARAPYGNRSFDAVYQYTLEAVEWLFSQGCELVVLACNTASAKALRQIQQMHLPLRKDHKRVLGVIRPTTENIGNYTKTKHVGIMGTAGTVKSNSYPMEIAKFFPDLVVSQEACPMWVYLVEHKHLEGEGADYFVHQNISRILEKDPMIDTLLLACTHYPLLEKTIRKFLPVQVKLVSQGAIVAERLEDYLFRHQEITTLLSRNGNRLFATTDDASIFNEQATLFFGDSVVSEHVILI
jgi:glutamate racemase